MINKGGLILSASQQRALDDASVQAGTSARKLMESAGSHAAEWMLDRLPPPRMAIVLAGPGGNGGDGLVVARILLQAGIKVEVFILREMVQCSRLVRIMAEEFIKAGGTIHQLGAEMFLLRRILGDADCIIDGLFGSGLTRPLIDEDADIITMMNDVAVPIISLDVPSGLLSDSGSLPEPAVRAEFTLAMAFYKPVHWLYPAAELCGEVQCVSVDYPRHLLDALVPMAHVASTQEIRAMLPVRQPAGHKGSFGRVLIVAGSQGMTGAAILCARGALRAGAGLVSVALPETIAPVIQAAVPEVITVPLPDCDGRLTDPDILDHLHDPLAQADVLAIGPGLSRDLKTAELVRRIIGGFAGYQVIDADAIHAIADRPELLASISDRAVLTPHPGEFAALIGSTAREVDTNRLDAIASFLSLYSLTVVLKGRPTVIGLPKGPLVVNPTGNTGLATGGSGDVLTGLMAGLLAGGSSIADAAIAGPFIHGLAADHWAASFSERSLTPSDLIEMLPRLLKELES
ncbi:MAG: NAD(P)H-hydrate dehydratase [Candidatus Atribacteria bacterium]|nr:MAG: NAD(P)H-hydrate dehydratase [Candidatus Atribacteria bacterium]